MCTSPTIHWSDVHKSDNPLVRCAQVRQPISPDVHKSDNPLSPDVHKSDNPLVQRVHKSDNPLAQRAQIR